MKKLETEAGPLNVPYPPQTPRQESILTLNCLQAQLQGIFFELENYSQHDPGNASLTKVIDLMDEIGKIRNRILKGDNEKNGKDENKN